MGKCGDEIAFAIAGDANFSAAVSVINAATGAHFGVRQSKEDFPCFVEIIAIKPGAAAGHFGFGAFFYGGNGLGGGIFALGIEIENALAGFALNRLAGANFIVSLGPQHGLA